MTQLQSHGGNQLVRRSSRFRFAEWRWFGIGSLLLLILVNRTVAAPVEPATVEAAARLLDLRTFPVMEEATESGRRTLGMLMYDAKGDAKTAYDFQRKQLSQRGWKELKGGYQDATNASGQFTKDGYTVAVSTSGAVGEPEKQGWSHVTVINHGNVSTSSLPVPKGVKPFYSLGGETSYLTESKVDETAAACRELLLAAGWEPYGQDDEGFHDLARGDAAQEHEQEEDGDRPGQENGDLQKAAQEFS